MLRFPGGRCFAVFRAGLALSPPSAVHHRRSASTRSPRTARPTPRRGTSSVPSTSASIAARRPLISAPARSRRCGVACGVAQVVTAVAEAYFGPEARVVCPLYLLWRSNLTHVVSAMIMFSALCERGLCSEPPPKRVMQSCLRHLLTFHKSKPAFIFRVDHHSILAVFILPE